MNKYELTVVVSAAIEDEARTSIIDKVKGLITKFGGAEIDVKEDGKKKLAYEIQKMSEAFYYFINFDAEATCPPQLDAQLRIMDGILRNMCVRVEE